VTDDLVAIEIDADTCIGSGACASLEPDAVEDVGDGSSRARPGVRLSWARAEALCRACPSGALRIRDGGPGTLTG
jgi:ferredoxin